VQLVNKRHVQNVPGRKSDVSDCQWLHDLLMVGCSAGASGRPRRSSYSGRPAACETLIQSAGTHQLRMQKALVQMNFQLPLVVTDITGLTGLWILRDIVAGQADPVQLAEHRDCRCRAN
jgi:transposase